MACRCSPALLTLRDQWNLAFPTRDKSSDGCCGDPAHAARTSDHNPDAYGYAHAYDLDEDFLTGRGDRPLMFYVPLLLGDSRTKYVIYERNIWWRACNTHGAKCWDAGGHAYNGANAHEHHLHLSIVATATHETRLWPMPPKKENDVTVKVWEVDGDQWVVLYAGPTPIRRWHVDSAVESQRYRDGGFTFEKQSRAVLLACPIG